AAGQSQSRCQQPQLRLRTRPGVMGDGTGSIRGIGTLSVGKASLARSERQAATGARPRSKTKSRYTACATAAQCSRYFGNPPVKSVSPRGLSLTLAPRYQVLALLSNERWASLTTRSIQPSS